MRDWRVEIRYISSVHLKHDDHGKNFVKIVSQVNSPLPIWVRKVGQKQFNSIRKKKIENWRWTVRNTISRVDQERTAVLRKRSGRSSSKKARAETPFLFITIVKTRSAESLAERQGSSAYACRMIVVITHAPGSSLKKPNGSIEWRTKWWDHPHCIFFNSTYIINFPPTFNLIYIYKQNIKILEHRGKLILNKSIIHSVDSLISPVHVCK